MNCSCCDLSVRVAQLEQAVADLAAALKDSPIAALVPVPVRPASPPVDMTSRASLQDVVRVVAAEWGITQENLLGRGRQRGYANPRHVAMYLASMLPGATLTHVGRWMGGRDHTTVIYARDHVAERCRTDPAFAARVQRCVDALSSNCVGAVA